MASTRRVVSVVIPEEKAHSSSALPDAFAEAVASVRTSTPMLPPPPQAAVHPGHKAKAEVAGEFLRKICSNKLPSSPEVHAEASRILREFYSNT